jgi:hypothetical protein
MNGAADAAQLIARVAAMIESFESFMIILVTSYMIPRP